MVTQAELYLVYTIPEGPEQTAKYDDLELKVKLNIAAARLARGKYRDVIDYCLQIKKEQPNNQKAFFRKATAHLELNELEEAELEILGLEKLPDSQANAAALRAKLKAYVRRASSQIADLNRARESASKGLVTPEGDASLAPRQTTDPQTQT